MIFQKLSSGNESTEDLTVDNKMKTNGNIEQSNNNDEKQSDERMNANELEHSTPSTISTICNGDENDVTEQSTAKKPSTPIDELAQDEDKNCLAFKNLNTEQAIDATESKAHENNHNAAAASAAAGNKQLKKLEILF